ncbi:MAG TPA: DUF2007 domain-containing protein [Burkholderiaceae bacterium]|jgi:hypothetical protein
MRTVYEAASAIEAHMLLDLLRQQGLAAQIHGEHLQGAIGELPAAGLVRLVIDEADYDAARAVIEHWESAQPAEIAGPAPRPAPGSWRRFSLGLVAGIGLSWAFCQWIATSDEPGGDPSSTAQAAPPPDSAAVTAPAAATRELDRNLDGKPDFVGHYDDSGMIDSAEADEDFDGTFETHMQFKNGMVELYEVDTDGDGIPDRRLHFDNGMLATTETLNPATGLPLRIDYYQHGVLVKAEVDTDHDGRLDTRFFYTPLGEVASSESMLP